MSPSYETIDPNFPIRSPYPIPSTVPQTQRNSKPGYAKQLPKDLWEETGVASMQPTSQPGSSSITCSAKATTFLRALVDDVGMSFQDLEFMKSTVGLYCQIVMRLTLFYPP